MSHSEHHDDSPVTDLISAQMEINQLSSEIERLRAQVKHWKVVAQSREVHCCRLYTIWHAVMVLSCRMMKMVQEKTRTCHSKFNLMYAFVLIATVSCEWRACLQALQRQLTEEVDLHQSQLAALQNAHTKKLMQMRNEHELEVAEREERIEELEGELVTGKQMSHFWSSSRRWFDVVWMQQTSGRL